jgi:AcrR family transcriptional regulator
MQAIADAANVAVQTVYAVFGSKAAILDALRDSVAEDAAADEAVGRARVALDTSEALGHFAHSIRLRWEAGYDLVAVHHAAAAADPALRPSLDVVYARRGRGILALAERLVDRDPGLGDPAHVAAVIDALTLPDVYRDLVLVHRWTPDVYEDWLAGMLRVAVRGPVDPG